MESHEVLRRAVEAVGAKQVARDLKVSTSLVYKWCEEPTKDGDEASGARNPLDRLAALVETTGNHDPVSWLCRRSGGFFVQDPQPSAPDTTTEYIAATQKMLHGFSELLSAISESINNDGTVDESESARIRAQWQRLKQFGEGFVRSCEGGRFDKP